jgi:hypothetical protein
VKPLLQVAQISALLAVQAAPVAATPFEQVQLLAWQTFPFFVKPVLQVPQISALLAVQAAPMAAYPFEQVQQLLPAW